MRSGGWPAYRRLVGSLLSMAIVLLGAGCRGPDVGEIMEGVRQVSAEVCDPATGTFSLDITNPYLPFAPGQQSVLEGRELLNRVKVQITVLSDTMVVAGVTTRVVEEREWVNDGLVEVSRNYVAQAADGSVCYFGEEVDDYEGGAIVGHGGAWRAGENGAQPGILMPGNPEVGTFHPQERAPGVAEDGAVIVVMGEPFTTPAGTFDDTLETNDVNPLSGSVDPKRYARGVGLIVDEAMVLTGFTP